MSKPPLKADIKIVHCCTAAVTTIGKMVSLAKNTNLLYLHPYWPI